MMGRCNIQECPVPMLVSGAKSVIDMKKEYFVNAAKTTSLSVNQRNELTLQSIQHILKPASGSKFEVKLVEPFSIFLKCTACGFAAKIFVDMTDERLS